MAEPVYTSILQSLHVGGGWLAFGAAPLALLAVKGTTGITAGLVLAAIDGAVGLFFFGLLALFLFGTGYLAPAIGRGSRSSYRWDRALTAVGIIGSLGLIGDGLVGMLSPWEGLSFGGLGLAIAVTHARWRSRWQVEHLTSLLAAYIVGWSFILGLYAGLQNRPGVVVPVLGLAAILWARRHFGPQVRIATARSPVGPLNGT